MSITTTAYTSIMVILYCGTFDTIIVNNIIQSAYGIICMYDYYTALLRAVTDL